MEPESLKYIAGLKEVYMTLHLVYHRNKNQHRNSKWWKWLSILKRSTLKLAMDVEELDNDIDGTIESRIKTRARYLLSEVVPKCYLYVPNQGK